MKKFLSVVLIIIAALFTACSADDGDIPAEYLPDGAEGILLAADHVDGNSWYCTNSDSSVMTANILTLDDIDNSVMVLEPVSSGTAEVTAVYSAVSGDLSTAAAMYLFDVEVSEDLTLSFSEVVPEPSVALRITEDGTYWELFECGNNIRVLEGAHLSSQRSNSVTYYFPIIAISPGESRAHFILKDSDGTILQNVVYNVKVADDLSVSISVRQ